MRNFFWNFLSRGFSVICDGEWKKMILSFNPINIRLTAIAIVIRVPRIRNSLLVLFFIFKVS